MIPFLWCEAIQNQLKAENIAFEERYQVESKEGVLLKLEALLAALPQIRDKQKVAELTISQRCKLMHEQTLKAMAC